MNINFIKMEIQNFKSVGELVELNFENLKGLNFIFGKNMDVPNAKNGSGKCLHPDTLINIKIDDQNIQALFNLFSKSLTTCTIKNVVDFYESFPEYRSLIYVNTPFGFKKILNAAKTDNSIPIKILTETNKQCVSSENHRFKIDNENFKFAKDFKVGDRLLTIDGSEEIILIKRYTDKIDLYDLEVEEVHQFYSNGIISHNSVIFSDAISFALFGKTIKNTNNRYIPNRSMPTTLKSYVKLYFRSNEQLYSCETYGRMAGKIMGTVGMELLKLNDDYSIIEDLTQSSIAKTKQYIVNNLIGCSFNVFKSSVVMTSSDFMNFYEGMTKDQKRKHIETIFNLDCFGEMFSMLKFNLNDIKKEMTMLRNLLISISKKIDDNTVRSENFDIDIDNRKNELKEILIDKTNELKLIQSQYNEIIVEDLSELILKQKNLSSKKQQLINDKVKLEKNLAKYESGISHNNKMICQMKKITNGLCEQCTSLINERYNYQESVNENLKYNNEIDLTKSKIQKLDEMILEFDKTLAEIREKLIEVNNIKSKKDNILYKMTSLKTEIKTLKEKFDELLTKTINPWVTVLNDLQKEKSNAIDQLNSYNKNFKHLELLKEACSENGVKRYIIKDIVKLLNSLIQKYLNEIGCEFIVYFDETFDFKFITMSGECEFSNFSAGEKQRIQIATLLAFRDLILNGKMYSNIFIVDELLDANVDTACIENVMNILKRKAEESQQNIFMISHRSELADNMSFWTNIIKVVKENQQSRYEII